MSMSTTDPGFSYLCADFMGVSKSWIGCTHIQTKRQKQGRRSLSIMKRSLVNLVQYVTKRPDGPTFSGNWPTVGICFLFTLNYHVFLLTERKAVTSGHLLSHSVRQRSLKIPSVIATAYNIDRLEIIPWKASKALSCVK